MEESNLLIKNWQEQRIVFLDNLAVNRKKPTKDSVHDMRVAVKKMRSYLKLKEELTGEKWKEEFAGILALFRSFGRLRDIEMSISIIRKQGRNQQASFANFKRYLTVNRSLVKKWVRQDAIKFDEQQLDGFVRNFHVPWSAEELVEKIIQLSGSKIKKAKQLSRHFQKKAHSARKDLKDVFYWLSICPADIANNVISLKALYKILDNLGKWQDRFLLVKKTNRYSKDLVTNKEEKKVLKEFQTLLISEQEELLERARKKWKG